ncbi:pirin family protein [Alteromonas sp. CYL-A6]|uniref:pirin family protein n=1 Tax=Alteromonas nitratireducens TaxID=3390813 RepID=UPI0034A6C303
MSRTVKSVANGIATSDGAGVALTRIIGQPALPRLDPFLMLDYFGSEEATDYIAGFPSHPHRGFQTVTYMLAGRMRHRDSVGNDGVIETGGIQWMNAGRGIIHEEMPEQKEGLLRGFQLWVNLPAEQKMSAPGYQDIPPSEVPIVNKPGVNVHVLAGNYDGATGPVTGSPVSPHFYDLRFTTQDSAEPLVVPLPASHSAFVYCYEGVVSVAGYTLTAGTLAVLTDGDSVSIDTPKGGKAILVAGEPIGEPVVQYGPFVMNTEAEIHQALHDYQTGRLA